MARVQGKERVNVQRNLYTGVAKLIPIAFNPTKEQLNAKTNGVKAFENDIQYKFTTNDGTSYKFDVWCKLNYFVDEAGNLAQGIEPADTITDYVCYSWWGRPAPDIIYNKEDNTVKGAWYVNSVTCDMEWIPENNVDKARAAKRNGKLRLDYNSPKTHLATQGEKELMNWLVQWLRLEEIDLTTPFSRIIQGDYTEINQVIQENLNRTDRAPRGFKALLGVKETDDNNYQSVYPYVILSEDQTNYNRLRDQLEKFPWKDNKSGNSFVFMKYDTNAPATTTTVNIQAPSSSGW